MKQKRGVIVFTFALSMQLSGMRWIDRLKADPDVLGAERYTLKNQHNKLFAPFAHNYRDRLAILQTKRNAAYGGTLVGFIGSAVYVGRTIALRRSEYTWQEIFPWGHIIGATASGLIMFVAAVPVYKYRARLSTLRQRKQDLDAEFAKITTSCIAQRKDIVAHIEDPLLDQVRERAEVLFGESIVNHAREQGMPFRRVPEFKQAYDAFKAQVKVELESLDPTGREQKGTKYQESHTEDSRIYSRNDISMVEVISGEDLLQAWKKWRDPQQVSTRQEIEALVAKTRKYLDLVHQPSEMPLLRELRMHLSAYDAQKQHEQADKIPELILPGAL